MSETDVLSIVDGAAPPPPDDRALADLPRNDYGNARRLCGRFGQELRFVDRSGWHHWDGRRWNKEAGELQALVRAQETALAIKDEAAAFAADPPPWINDKELKGWYANHKNWGVKSGNLTKANAMLAMAAPHLWAGFNEMDSHPFLLNVENGTLELDPAGGAPALRPADQGDLLTSLAEVTYDPAAGCPAFRKFMVDILPDPEMRLFLQIYFGYCLSGDIREQVLLCCYGKGGNGKSTLLGLIAEILNDYAVGLPIQSFLHNDRRGGADATPDLVRLPAARMLMASEPDEGSRLSESAIKSMTGGEKMQARFLRGEFFDFFPHFKIILSFNNRPQIRGKDEGIWRRLRMLPFEQKFENNADDTLPARLRGEKPGILNWMLDGYSLWRERGLPYPEKIRAATHAYRSESDPIGEFVLANCDRRDGLTIQASRFYQAYAVWAKANNENELNATIFGRRLRSMGIEKDKIGGFTVYQDIGLTAQAEAELLPQDSLGDDEGDT